MRAGYDLDGTIFPPWPKRPKPYFKQTAAERAAFDEICLEFCKRAPLVRRPRRLSFFITGRQKKFKQATERRLRELGVEFQRVFYVDRPRTRKNLIDFKAETINKLKLDIFYEDDPLIAKELAVRCPNTAIVLVSDALAEPEFMRELTFMLPESAAEVVEKAISTLQKKAPVSRSKAIEFICADFLAK